MTQEQPLIGIEDIARYWKCSETTARKELKRKHIPTFYIGRNQCVYISTLKKFCEGVDYSPEVSESVPNDTESEGS